MATELLSDISAALSQAFADKLSRQWNRSAVLAQGLGDAEPATNNGKNIAWDAEMDNATAYNAAEGQVLTASDASFDKVVPATLPWAIYQSSFSLTDLEISAAARSLQSATALENILGERVMANGAKVASLFNKDCWSGTGTGTGGNVNVVGITGGALAAAGLYANINRGTYPEWSGNILANGSVARPLTADLMANALQVIFEKSSQTPSGIYCDTGTFRKYKGLFEAIRRVEGEGPIKRYDTSTSNLFFEGIPIFQDKDAPAGTMAFVNSSYVKKVFLPSDSDTNADSSLVATKDMSGSDGESAINPVSIPMRIVALGRTGNFTQFFVEAVANVKFSRPNTCAVIQDIAV